MTPTLKDNYYKTLGLTMPEEELYIEHNQYRRQLTDFSRGMTLLQEFFCHTPLGYLKKNKDFFIKNRNDPHFQGLMLFCIPSFGNSYKERLEFLLDCGYDPNVIINQKKMLIDIENYRMPNGHLYSMDGLTPLHYFLNKKPLELLIKYGANPNQTITMFEYLNDFCLENNISQIKTKKDIQNYLEFEKNYAKKIKEPTFFQELFSNMNDFIDSSYSNLIKDRVNLWLKLSQEKNINAYRLAILCQDKQKHLLLKSFESKDTLEEEEKKVGQLILNKYSQNDTSAYSLMTQEIKKRNQYIEENIESFLPLFQNKEKDIFNRVLREGSMSLVKKLVDNQYVVDHDKATYLETCYTYHKTEVFSYLFEHGFKNGLEQVVSHINKRLEFPFESLSHVSAGIVYFLSKNGYHFEHTKVMEKIIAYEKERLSQIEVSSLDEAPKKRMKI